MGNPYQFLLYLPFGETMAEQNVAEYDTPYKYTGQELDAETGYYYYGARYYDPRVSQFIGVDPLASMFPGQSSFIYAYNNPVRFIDVHGLYGDENEANRQRDLAVKQGLNVGNVYKSGKEWMFNVVNGENSYSTYKKDFSQSSNSLGTEVGILGTVASAMEYDQYNSKQWKGTNGKYYNTNASPGKSKPFYGNQHTGSVNIAKGKAALVGIAGNVLGAYSLAATHNDYKKNLEHGYGPNMERHLKFRYKVDQAANGTGFLGFWGAVSSFGYNAGHLIESWCNCNIQYNPITKDFTPIEETLMEYDRLGIDLMPPKKK